MLGKHNRSSAVLDRSPSDWSTPSRRLATFAKKIQQQQRKQHLTVAADENVEILVGETTTTTDPSSSSPLPPSAANRDFVTKLRQLARAHVVEAAERSRSEQLLLPGRRGAADKQQQQLNDESTAATENTTSDDNNNNNHVIIEEKTTESQVPKNDEPQGSKTARPFRAFREMLEWTEWTRCGPCAVGWNPNNSGGRGVGAFPLTRDDKRSSDQIRLYQHSIVVEQQITPPEEIDEKIYAPPVDFDMDKTVTTISVPYSIPHTMETTDDDDDDDSKQQLSGGESIGTTRWTMSYATTTGGATTTDYYTTTSRSYIGAEDSSSSYASSLYSSFASEPVHFDDSTTITTNY